MKGTVAQKKRWAHESYLKGVSIHKGTALNAIAKIYHPKYKFGYDQYSDLSYAEQRESHIEYIIKRMNKRIKEERIKYKKKLEEIDRKKSAIG